MESPRLDFFITGIFFSSLNCAIRTASGIAPGGETAPPGRMLTAGEAVACWGATCGAAGAATFVL